MNHCIDAARQSRRTTGFRRHRLVVSERRGRGDVKNAERESKLGRVSPTGRERPHLCNIGHQRRRVDPIDAAQTVISASLRASSRTYILDLRSHFPNKESGTKDQMLQRLNSRLLPLKNAVFLPWREKQITIQQHSLFSLAFVTCSGRSAINQLLGCTSLSRNRSPIPPSEAFLAPSAHPAFPPQIPLL
jgi:hypothetical protein